MKAGWFDLKYIPPRPVISLRKANHGKLISPYRAVIYAVRYSEFREETMKEGNSSPSAQPLWTIPGKQLSRKLGYDVHREEENLTESRLGQAEPQQGRKHPIHRIPKSGGLGTNEKEIADNCSRLQGQYFYGLSVLSSFEPDIIACAERHGIDPVDLTESCNDVLIQTLCEELGWGDTIEYASVRHLKEDATGRPRWHHHNTLAGTGLDLRTGQRVEPPKITPDTLREGHRIADRVLEEQMDLRLGRGWRLEFPEYASTFYVPDVLPVPETDDELDVWFPRPIISHTDSFGEPDKVTALIDKLFPDELWETDTAQTTTLETIDSFGDEVEIARLIADSFPDFDLDVIEIPRGIGLSMDADEGAATRLTSPADDALTVEVEAADSTADLAQTAAVERLIQPDVQGFSDTEDWETFAELSDFGVELEALPASDTEDEVSPEIALSRPSSRPTMTIRLEKEWIAALGYGRIIAHIAWSDPTPQGGLRLESVPIFQTSIADHLFFYADRMDLEGAVQDAQVALDEQFRALEAAQKSNPNGGIEQVFVSWFETMPVDSETQELGFVPDLPREMLPFDEEIIAKGLERLAPVRWIADPFLRAEIGFTLAPLAENNFALISLMRSTDANDIQQITVFPMDVAWDNLQDSAQALWDVTRGLQRDFDENSAAAHAKWSPLFASHDSVENPQDNNAFEGEVSPAEEDLDDEQGDSDEGDTQDEIEDDPNTLSLDEDWDI